VASIRPWFKRIWTPIVDTYRGGASKRLAFFAIVLGLFLIAALVFVFAVLPGLAVGDEGLTADTRLQRENDARTAGLQALAGFVVAIGGAFTAFSVLSNREGQLDERFSRSLDRLASDDSYVASGAVYSLERIAVQSGSDRAAVVDVLAGFIKARAPGEDEIRRSFGPERQEVADALTVLGRVKDLWQSPAPNLEKTSWTVGHLNSKNLSGMRLSDSNLETADLSRTNLKNANLSWSRLGAALVRETDLRGANLKSANLERARLTDARLDGADLSRANLDRASIDEETSLTGAKLDEASFFGAEIHAKSFLRASLVNARYSADTRFPQGFDPAEHGMTLESPEDDPAVDE
jgi:hypothetical protein